MSQGGHPLTPLTIVLAGGLGTRLRAVVRDRPKPMSLVAGRPFLEYALGHLRSQGVRRIFLAVGYMGETIREHFGDGSRFGLEIEYSDEGDRLLGTGGAVRRALAAAGSAGGEPVLIMNGDTYVDFDLSALRASHAGRGAAVTMVAVRMADVSRYGAVDLDSKGAVVAFREKGHSGFGCINGGVYFGATEVFERLLPAKGPGSLEALVLRTLAGRGLYAHVTAGVFIDIGVPHDYRRAQALLARRVIECP